MFFNLIVLTLILDLFLSKYQPNKQHIKKNPRFVKLQNIVKKC